MSHFGCESFEYKVDNAAREASAGAGHAFAAGGRRVMDSEIGLSQGDDYEMPWRVGASGDDYASPHQGPCWRSPTFRGPARR